MDLYKIRKDLNMGIPLANMHIKVTFYSRVSTDHLEQKTSLNNQINYFKEMINNNKDWEYIDGYVDDGISGTNALKRDSFMKMIDDAKKGLFDLIVTKEISRFSRNTLDSIKYTRELLSYGVAVLFINDNINTVLPDSELRLTIMASLAQDEIRRLSERVKFGMDRAIKRGVILGNDLLYGYKKDNNGNLKIIKEEAIIVKRLFNLYVLYNHSINKIANLFNIEGIRTKENKKWSAITLSRMLRNPKYKGFYCGKKAEIIDYMTKRVKKNKESDWIIYKDYKKIPPIIKEELWEKANNKLNHKYKNKKYNGKYLLSNKIYCEKDNVSFYRRYQCRNNNDITWLCSNYLKNGKKYCDSPNIRESELYYIFDDIIKLLKIDLMNVYKILINLYKNNIKKNIIKRLLNEREVKEKIVDLLIKKIIASKINNTIILKILLNIDCNNINKEYVFKRGYNTTSTKRYCVNYSIFIEKNK